MAPWGLLPAMELVVDAVVAVAAAAVVGVDVAAGVTADHLAAAAAVVVAVVAAVAVVVMAVAEGRLNVRRTSYHAPFCRSLKATILIHVLIQSPQAIY